MAGGRRHRVDEIPQEQFAVVGANIRTLRQRRGWTQRQLGKLMGWPTTATVCAAEGHRGSRQRGFTGAEIIRLAAIFGVSAQQLTTLCANCGGNPPSGFACLTCEARNWQAGPADRPGQLPRADGNQDRSGCSLVPSTNLRR